MIIMEEVIKIPEFRFEKGKFFLKWLNIIREESVWLLDLPIKEELKKLTEEDIPFIEVVFVGKIKDYSFDQENIISLTKGIPDDFFCYLLFEHSGKMDFFLVLVKGVGIYPKKYVSPRLIALSE